MFPALVWDCSSSHARPRARGDSPGTCQGLGTAGACASSPLATVPTALTALCCTHRGREGELYLCGGVAARGLLLEDCQVPSEDLPLQHTRQLELFPELQALSSSFTAHTNPVNLGAAAELPSSSHWGSCSVTIRPCSCIRDGREGQKPVSDLKIRSTSL